MHFVMNKYILTHCSEMIKPTTTKKFFTVYFVTQGEVQKKTQKLNLKQEELMFLNESFTVRINVHVLLHSLKPIMKPNILEKDLLSMKRWFEEI